MTNLAVAEKMVSSMVGSDFDTMLTTLADNVSMTTPMGPQKGKAAVGATLKMFVGMGAKPSNPVQDGEEIYSTAMSPMGPTRIYYTVEDGLITVITTKLG
jgi:hypothetical protein